MKKILLLLTLIGLFPLIGNGQQVKIVKYYPQKSFNGVTKDEKGIYGNQSIASEPKEILIGYDLKNKKTGRGYLEFRLDSWSSGINIPSDATINSVELCLTSALKFSSNFGGKTIVFLAPSMFTSGEFEWNSLKKINQDYAAVLTPVFQREGNGYFFTSNLLKSIFKPGTTLYLSISNMDESKVVWLSGEPNHLFLEVKYTLKGCNDTYTTKNFTESITGPALAKSNQNITYTVKTTSGSNVAEYTWDYDKNYFQREGGTANSITLKVINNTAATKTIKAIGVYTDEQNCVKNVYTSQMNVSIVAKPVSSYAIDGPANITSGKPGTYTFKDPNSTNVAWKYDTSLFELVSSTNSGTATITLKAKNVEAAKPTSINVENDNAVQSKQITIDPKPMSSTPIQGYYSIVAGESVTYTFTEANIGTVKWVFDTSFLEEVARSSTSGSASITLRAKNININNRTTSKLAIETDNSKQVRDILVESIPIIIGPDIICPREKAKYTTDYGQRATNLYGSSLVWSHGYSGAPYPILIPDYYTCTIEDIYAYPVSMTLKATYKRSGRPDIVVTKNVRSVSSTSFPKGTYTAWGALGVSFLKEGVISGNPVWVPKGEILIIFDNSLKGKQIWSMSSTCIPLLISKQTDTSVFIRFNPNQAGPYDFYIGDKNLPECTYARLTFFTYNMLKSAVETPLTLFSVKVYNIHSGLLMLQEKNVTEFNIENTNLEKGVYIIETTDETGNIKREKVMKTR